MHKLSATLIVALAIGGATSFNIISAQADPVTLALTPAGTALFTQSTFADNFPNAFCGPGSGNCGPLGIAFPTSGGVMVTDYPGNVRVFPTDTDNQNAATVPVAQSYGQANAVGLATSGGNIYMTQQSAGAGNLVQLNNNGTFNQSIISGSLPAATGITTDPNTGHFYVSTLGNNTIWNVDPIAKTQTAFVSASADGLTINAAGTILYGEVGGHILGWNTTTGLQIFDSGFINGADGVAIGASGSLAGQLFVNTNFGQVVDVDIATLTQTVIATGGTRGDFVTVDPLNDTLLLTQSDDIVRLTPINGSLEGGNTPIPAALPLFASGIGVIGLLARRRKRKSAIGVSA
jgi:hypothetical protein